MTEESYATLMEPTIREVQSRKAVPQVVYWFERGGSLVLTGMPRPVLGESWTTSIKDFAMSPHQKKKKKMMQCLELVTRLIHRNQKFLLSGKVTFEYNYVTYSEDKVFMGKGHLVHFEHAQCEINS